MEPFPYNRLGGTVNLNFNLAGDNKLGKVGVGYQLYNTFEYCYTPKVTSIWTLDLADSTLQLKYGTIQNENQLLTDINTGIGMQTKTIYEATLDTNKLYNVASGENPNLDWLPRVTAFLYQYDTGGAGPNYNQGGVNITIPFDAFKQASPQDQSNIAKVTKKGGVVSKTELHGATFGGLQRYTDSIDADDQIESMQNDFNKTFGAAQDMLDCAEKSKEKLANTDFSSVKTYLAGKQTEFNAIMKGYKEASPSRREELRTRANDITRSLQTDINGRLVALVARKLNDDFTAELNNQLSTGLDPVLSRQDGNPALIDKFKTTKIEEFSNMIDEFVQAYKNGGLCDAQDKVAALQNYIAGLASAVRDLNSALNLRNTRVRTRYKSNLADLAKAQKAKKIKNLINKMKGDFDSIIDKVIADEADCVKTTLGIDITADPQAYAALKTSVKQQFVTEFQSDLNAFEAAAKKDGIDSRKAREALGKIETIERSKIPAAVNKEIVKMLVKKFTDDFNTSLTAVTQNVPAAIYNIPLKANFIRKKTDRFNDYLASFKDAAKNNPCDGAAKKDEIYKFIASLKFEGDNLANKFKVDNYLDLVIDLYVDFSRELNDGYVFGRIKVLNADGTVNSNATFRKQDTFKTAMMAQFKSLTGFDITDPVMRNAIVNACKQPDAKNKAEELLNVAKSWFDKTAKSYVFTVNLTGRGNQSVTDHIKAGDKLSNNAAAIPVWQQTEDLINGLESKAQNWR